MSEEEEYNKHLRTLTPYKTTANYHFIRDEVGTEWLICRLCGAIIVPEHVAIHRNIRNKDHCPKLVPQLGPAPSTEDEDDVRSRYQVISGRVPPGIHDAIINFCKPLDLDMDAFLQLVTTDYLIKAGILRKK